MMDLDLSLQASAAILRDPALYARLMVGVPLRAYQLDVARAVLDSVLGARGLTFAVLMARQAGKNETSALLEALLLALYHDTGGWIVKASPTFRPQTLNSILRLEARLANPCTGHLWRREAGCTVRVGKARALFLSAQPGASVVGATASILLEADEAQDIAQDKWDKDFRPMGAATNVTTVLWGTAWTPDTLLARAVAALRRLEAQDGQRRVFVVPWPEVAAEVPAYARYVESEIARLGPTHPIIRTQYALEDVDAMAPMFPAARQALMRGTHLPELERKEGSMYALTVDVGGAAVEGESAAADPSTRDCTAATLFVVRHAGEGEPLQGKVRYHVVGRFWWRGVGQTELYERLSKLIETWSPRHVVVDATGIGAGLAAFLQQRWTYRILPFTFTAATKSDLGWSFLAICDTGRFKDHALDRTPAQAEFWHQVAAAQYELLPGPARRLRWGVGRGHDDLLISAALCGVLDGESWSSFESVIIPPPCDPLDDPNWWGDESGSSLDEYEHADLYAKRRERFWQRTGLRPGRYYFNG